MFFFECFYFIYKLQVNVQLWSSRQRSLVNGVKLKCQYLVHCRNLFPTNYYCTHMQIMKLLALYHYHFTMEINNDYYKIYAVLLTCPFTFYLGLLNVFLSAHWLKYNSYFSHMGKFCTRDCCDIMLFRQLYRISLSARQ